MTYLVTHKLDYVQQAVLTVSFEIILLKDVYKCALQIQITLRMSKIKYVWDFVLMACILLLILVEYVLMIAVFIVNLEILQLINV